MEHKALVTGYRLQVTGYRLPVTGYRLPVTGYRLPVTGYRLQIIIELQSLSLADIWPKTAVVSEEGSTIQMRHKRNAEERGVL